MTKETTLTGRELEALLLDRCVAVARQTSQVAQDQREANVFRLAAMVIQSRFPNESMRLMQASERYFEIQPHEQLKSVEVVRNGWVLGLPRLRDMLSHRLSNYREN